MTLDGGPATTAAGRHHAAGFARPGDAVRIGFEQRGVRRDAVLTAAADTTIEVVRGETAGIMPSPAQLTFRRAWLGND